MERLKWGCILSPLHLVTLTVHVDKSPFSKVLSQAASVSDQQTTLWVCTLSLQLQIPEQLELHVHYADSFGINLQKTTQKRQVRRILALSNNREYLNVIGKHKEFMNIISTLLPGFLYHRKIFKVRIPD